jgi:hypothetical protein
MNAKIIQRISTTQKYFLLVAIIFLLVTTPQFWIIAPDSGYYVGTAQSIVSSFQYFFNDLPNILYYPGISTLLAIPMSISGENFWLFQFYFAVISLAAVWLSKHYFSYENYGLVGMFVPIFLLLCSKYLFHVHTILSDTIFLTFTLLCLVFWRYYEQTKAKKYLLWCIALASFCSLIRFQGIFICVALSLSLFVQFITSDKQHRKEAFYLVCAVTFIVFLPFLMWTIRNYFLHTADAFTMSNSFFFGLKGLLLYAKGLTGNIDSSWIDSNWKATAYRFVFFFGGLAEFWVGSLTTNQKAIFTLILIPLILLGAIPWFKRATILERFYIIISVLFILKSFFGGRSIYVVTRYWIPLLPFVIACIGFGLQSIVNYHHFKNIQKGLQGSVALIIFVLIGLSLPNLVKHIEKESRYENITASFDAIQKFTASNIPENSKIATMEWGVLPYILKRQSFPVLNDPDHYQTINRILKYKIDYLVIDSFSRTSDISSKMTEQYPQAFRLVFETHTDVEYAQAQIFKIDLSALNELRLN